MMMLPPKPKPLIKVGYLWGVRGYTCECIQITGWGVTEAHAYAQWEAKWEMANYAHHRLYQEQLNRSLRIYARDYTD